MSTANKAQLVAKLEREVQVMGAQAVLFHAAMAEILGLNVTDLRCLTIARGEVAGSPVTAGQLAEMTGLTTGAITGVIDRLARAGLVRRKPDPNDRRRVLIEPTNERTEELTDLFRPMSRSMHELWMQYSEKELRVLFDAYKRSAPIFREATAELSARAISIHDPAKIKPLRVRRAR